MLIGYSFNIKNNVNIPLQKKFSISYFRENALRKILLAPYKKWNKCCSSLLLDFTFKSLMSNCKVHGDAMNSSPSTCTLWARNLLLDTEVTHLWDTVSASPEENAHAQKGQKVLTMLPSLKALHTDGAVCKSTEGTSWQPAAPHTSSGSGYIRVKSQSLGP